MATTDERIASLEVIIAELRAQLDRPPRRDSMRQTLTCPCCGGGRILGVKQVKEYTHGGLTPLALGNKTTWFADGSGDPLQAYVCRGCRYVEWHVASLDKLVPDGENVIEMVRPEQPLPQDAPYR